MEAVPLRDGKGALNVNWLSVTITNEKGKTTYDGAFVTSLPITAENVVETAACAPARWKTRERKLQRAEEQRLQFGPQLRPRQEISGKNVRRHELAGLRLPHRLRLHGNPSGNKHARRSAPAKASFSTCTPSPPTSSFPQGTASSVPYSQVKPLPFRTAATGPPGQSHLEFS